MAAAGFDVAQGDTWVVNEFTSAVRRGDGQRPRERPRVRARPLRGRRARGPTRGAVFVVGLGQRHDDVSVYQTNLQNWLADSAFWTDMSDVRQRLVAGGVRRRPQLRGAGRADHAVRRDYLNDYLQHKLVLAGPGRRRSSSRARSCETAYSPLANAAWQ